jgi:hypothetical protein
MARTHTLPRGVKLNPFIGAAAVTTAPKSHYASVADSRTTKPVGGKTIPDAETQHAKGHEARGWALAQQVITISGHSLSRDLARCVLTAFDYDVTEREYAAKRLRQWAKECKANAENNGNLAKSSLSENGGKALRRMASSAATRGNQFGKILTTMNGGMDKGTICKDLGISEKDLPDVGFDVYYQLALKFGGTNAQGRGRPADPWHVKLAKWLERNAPAEDEAKPVLKLAKQVIAEVTSFVESHPVTVSEAEEKPAPVAKKIPTAGAVKQARKAAPKPVQVVDVEPEQQMVEAMTQDEQAAA